MKGGNKMFDFSIWERLCIAFCVSLIGAITMILFGISINHLILFTTGVFGYQLFDHLIYKLRKESEDKK